MIYLQDRQIAVIGIDHGYGNIKTANTITPTGVSVYTSEPLFHGDTLIFNGAYYRVGEGHKEFITDKATDEDFYILTLMGIARELGIRNIQEASVHLAVGLPLTWVRSQQQAFRQYLTKNREVEFVFNKKAFNIHVVGCSVYPQGYAAVVGQYGLLKGSVLLADIGNGTMNMLYIEDKRPDSRRCWTEKLGVNQCLIRAKNAIWDKYGAKVDDAIVERILRTGTADVAQKYIDCVTEVARRYVGEIFDTLRRYEYNPDFVRLLIVGGGGCLVRNFGSYDTARTTILDDLCAAAKGYEFLASAEYRRR